MATELKKVVAVKDNDGHWYVIPAEMKDQFSAELEKGEEDEYETFNEKFGDYSTGGDLNLIQLYAEI